MKTDWKVIVVGLIKPPALCDGVVRLLIRQSVRLSVAKMRVKRDFLKN